MFERFTEKAIKVIMLAQEESRRLGHNFVGSEQIPSTSVLWRQCQCRQSTEVDGCKPQRCKDGG